MTIRMCYKHIRNISYFLLEFALELLFDLDDDLDVPRFDGALWIMPDDDASDRIVSSLSVSFWFVDSAVWARLRSEHVNSTFHTQLDAAILSLRNCSSYRACKLVFRWVCVIPNRFRDIY